MHLAILAVGAAACIGHPPCMHAFPSHVPPSPRVRVRLPWLPLAPFAQGMPVFINLEKLMASRSTTRTMKVRDARPALEEAEGERLLPQETLTKEAITLAEQVRGGKGERERGVGLGGEHVDGAGRVAACW